jgi:hypothetical protein
MSDSCLLSLLSFSPFARQQEPFPDMAAFHLEVEIFSQRHQQLVYHSLESCQQDMPKSLYRAAMMLAAGAQQNS